VDSSAARDRIAFERVDRNALVIFDASFLGRGVYGRKGQEQHGEHARHHYQSSHAMPSFRGKSTIRLRPNWLRFSRDNNGAGKKGHRALIRGDSKLLYRTLIESRLVFSDGSSF
jgi:hypothetical protein